MSATIATSQQLARAAAKRPGLVETNARRWFWLAVVVLVVVGNAAELLNSALEAVLDKLHPDLDPAIGAAKEMASGAAAVVNLAAVVVFVGAILASTI